VYGGTDTAIWRVESGGEVYALRVFQRGQQNACLRERKVMQAAQTAGLPVPQVYAVGEWQEYPALLLGWLPGRTVFAELRARPWKCWQLGVASGRMHATIHALPAPDLLLQQPDDWIEWPGSEEAPLQERLRLIECQVPALLHMDYHPLNVLTDGKRITAVLDWRNACAGVPQADFARTASILRVDTIGRPGLFAMGIRRIFEAGWRAGYAEKNRLAEDLSLFYAWSGAVMERDLAAKRSPEDLARIHKWTLKWKRRAGCL
jgi:aminoglycoside phosphotransferase (APT) family kinase protein